MASLNYDVLLGLNIIASVLSVWGTLYLFKSLAQLPVLSIAMRMVLLLGIGDFIFTIANILQIFNTDHYICLIEGVLRLAGASISVSMSMFIAILSMKTIQNPKEFNQQRFFVQASSLTAFIVLVMGLL